MKKKTEWTAKDIAKALKKSRRNSEQYQKLFDELCSKLDDIREELDYCDCLSDKQREELEAEFEELCCIEEEEDLYQFLRSLPIKTRIVRIFKRIYWTIRRLFGYKPKLVQKTKSFVVKEA